MHPRRTRGSWIPRLAGVGVVVVIAGGGIAYFSAAHHNSSRPPGSARVTGNGKHPHASLSAKVIKQQTVGLIDFGPYDDRDSPVNDFDDHPLMLQPSNAKLLFALVPRSELSAGQPTWTADQMADGSDIFIYNPTGRCLTAAADSHHLRLAHCQLELSQRWRPLHAAIFFGQAFSAFLNAETGTCLTAPRHAGAALLARCDAARTKDQEIAFFWSL